MTRNAAILVTALLVVLAGCGGFSGPQSETGGTTPAGTATDTAAGGDTATATNGGRVNFYVSDQRNAIGDFAHLNVTVTRVGFVAADGNESTGTNESTATPTNGSDEDARAVREVNATTVDLTRLQGDNATLVETLSVPEGSYDRAVLYVSDVEGTLQSGEETAVKLPSEKLQVQSAFTVGENETVDFVFDIAVHEAGGSGKYVVRPVISQSGTDVPIRRADRDRERDRDRDRTRLGARLVGNVTPGGNATVRVRRGDAAVSNATVFVNGERSGTTNATGEFAFTVPAGGRLTVRIRDENRTLTLRRRFETNATAEDGSDGGQSAGSDGGQSAGSG